MDPSKTKLFASLALGLLSAAGAWIYLSQQEKNLLHRAEEQEVLVASRYIPAFTRLDETYLEFRKIPGEYLTKGTVRHAEDLKDMVSVAPFNSREPILFNKLAHSSQNLAAAVPEGKRALAVPVDPVSGIAGLIRPGDIVDVLWMTSREVRGEPELAATLFQAVRVVAAGNQFSNGGNSAEKGQVEAPVTVALALSPRDCQLAVVAMSRGRLQLSLRPPDDQALVDLKTADLSSVMGKIREKDDFILQRK